MPPVVALRPARPEDRAFLVATRREAFGALVEALWAWDDGEQRRRAHEHFDATPTAVVEERGRAVGYVCVVHGPTEDRLDEIALVASARGRGLGTLLIREAARTAEARGCALRLGVLLANERARALYERLGFAAVRVDGPRLELACSPPRP